MADFTVAAGQRWTATQWNANMRDQLITICTSTTRPASPVTGRRIFETDTLKTLVWDGASWVELGKLGPWQTYTPSWTAVTTNPVLNNGTITGRSQRLFGRIGLVTIQLTAGSTTTFGAGAWRFSLPSGWVLNTSYPLSWGGGLDLSAGNLLDIRGIDAGAGLVFAYYAAVTASVVNLAPLAAATPITWATGDTVQLTVLAELTS